MQFIVKKEDLSPLLSRVNNVIEKKSTQKVRTHVLINVRENEVELIGFDNDLKVSGTVPAQTSSTGTTTVMAHKLNAIVQSASNNSEIIVELKDSTLDIIAGDSQFHLSCIPAEDYPLPDSYEFNEGFNMPCDALVQLINQIKFSMANNDVRHYLNGMLLHFEKNTIAAVSTDGHRLSISETENISGIEEKKIILPRKAALEIIGWLNGQKGELRLNLSDSHIQLVYGNMELTSTVINAEYPAYETVIPELSEKTIVVPKSELRQALQRAKILSSEFGVGVSLTFNPWKLHLSAKNMDNESVEGAIDINYEGEIIKTAFNINYLLEIINVIENENLTLSLKDGQSSCVIYDADKNNARYVVMPMNI